MRLLVDAQLPARLARVLVGIGHDAVHTLDLPAGNRTPDKDLAVLADTNSRIVVSKDRDFAISHLLGQPPCQLLLVSTGNIANPSLVALFTKNLELIEAAFTEANFVELTTTELIVHGSR